MKQLKPWRQRIRERDRHANALLRPQGVSAAPAEAPQLVVIDSEARLSQALDLLVHVAGGQSPPVAALVLK